MKTTGKYDHEKTNISECMNVDSEKAKRISNTVLKRFMKDERAEISRLLEIVIEECDTVDEAVLGTYLVTLTLDKLQSMAKIFEQ